MDLYRGISLVEHPFNILGSVTHFCRLLGSHTSQLRKGLGGSGSQMYTEKRYNELNFSSYVQGFRTKQKIGVGNSHYLRLV